MYDVDPKDGRLTYEEIKPVSTFIQFNRNSKTFRIVEIGLKKCIHLFLQVPALAVSETQFRNGFDLNKDGSLTIAELAAVVFTEKLNGPLAEAEDEE